jgi:hypothetical protein
MNREVCRECREYHERFYAKIDADWWKTHCITACGHVEVLND